MPRTTRFLEYDDFIAARRWLDDKVGDVGVFMNLIPDPSKRDAAWKEYRGSRANHETTALAAWCDRWLPEAERARLSGAIRAARKRRRDRHERDGTKTVTLSRQAWRVLADLARAEGMTLSAFIIDRHEGDWMELTANDEPPAAGAGRVA